MDRQGIDKLTLWSWLFGAPAVADAPSGDQPPGPPSPPIDPAIAIAAALDEPMEGLSLTVYPDPGTHGAPWTQGYGSTRDDNGNPLTPNSPPITEAKAVDWLMRDMHAAFAEVERDVTVPLTTNEHAALVSLLYNIGAGNFRSSTLLRLLNQGDYAGAAAQFDQWDHAAGKVLAGLLRRRQAETALFDKPFSMGTEA